MVLAAPLGAQSTAGVAVSIPFEFVVSGKTLPAGQYNLEPFGTALRIKSTDGQTILFAFTNSVYGPATADQLPLIFRRYETTHFLAQFWTPPSGTIGYQLTKIKMEIKMAKDKAGPEIKSVVAQAR